MMFGRKLTPSLRKLLRAGRIAKGSRVPNPWTVTSTDPARAKSLATAVYSAAAPLHCFRPSSRFAVASREEPGRGVEEESGDACPSQYDQGLPQDCSSRRRSRKRRKQRKVDTVRAVAVPAPEEDEESAEEYQEEEESSGGQVALPDLAVNQRGIEEDSCASTTGDCADAHSRAKVFRTLLASSCPAPSDEAGTEEESSEGEEDPGEADRHFWEFEAAAGVLAVLLPPAVVRFVGRARLRVLQGALDVEGHVLVAGEGPSEGQLLLQAGGSPVSGGPAHLRALPLGAAALLAGGGPLLWRTLSRLGLDHAWPQLQPLAARRGAALLLLHRAVGACPEGGLGFRLRSQQSWPHPWRQQVHGLARDLALGPTPEGSPGPLRVVVCGRQNTGKSSLLRVVANTLLNVCPEVLYLDCDPGQCEFTPPATVSLTRVTKALLGPPFTHVQTPLKALFVGHVSPVSQPDSYCRAVQSLVEYASQVAPPETPLLVNTMGWLSGLGLSLLVDVVRWVGPTDVVQLVAEGADVDLPLLDEALLGTACGWRTSRGHRSQRGDVAFHRLPGATHRARSWARAKREAMLLAYLGRQQQQPAAAAAAAAATGVGGGAPFWLWNTVPLRVPMSLVAVHDCDNAVPKQQLLRAICGTVVALCVVPTHWMLETEKPGYPKFINHSGPYECLGYGLVRGVDTCKQYLYISTPEPAHRLAEVNALVRGDLHLPESCLAAQAELLQCGCAPYVARASRASSSAGSDDVGEEEDNGRLVDDDIPHC